MGGRPTLHRPRGLGVYLATSLLAAAAIACAPTRTKGRSARTESSGCKVASGDDVQKGVANEGTWLDVDGFDTRMHTPAGWQWAQQGSMIVANKSASAELVIAGACTQSEAKQTLARASKEFGLTIAGDVPEREIVLNGLHATRIDFAGGSVAGKPARGVAVVADSPNGKGYIVLLGYVLEGHEPLGHDLRDAIESISPR